MKTTKAKTIIFEKLELPHRIQTPPLDSKILVAYIPQELASIPLRVASEINSTTVYFFLEQIRVREREQEREHMFI